MKAPITEAIDSIVNQHLAPALKREGFRKKGQRFWRQIGPLIHVAEIERWKYNEHNSGRFTIAVGAYCDGVWQLQEELRPGWGDGHNPTPPPIQNCLVHDMVLNPGTVDGDWEVDATDSIEPLANLATAAVLKTGLSWFDAHRTLPDCVPRLRELSKKNSWHHSVYLFCIGALLKNPQICLEALPQVLDNPNRRWFTETQREAFRNLADAISSEENAS